MERAVVNYAGRTTGFVPPLVKVYELFGPGAARFSSDEVQVVIPQTYPTTKGTGALPGTLFVTVYLFNGNKFDVKAEYEEELLGYLKE